MAKVKVKPIHLIYIRYGYECRAVCNICVAVKPIETVAYRGYTNYRPKGTFDPEKVTCKRCLKSGDYKTAMDRLKYPLFFLKEDK